MGNGCTDKITEQTHAGNYTPAYHSAAVAPAENALAQKHKRPHNTRNNRYQQHPVGEIGLKRSGQTDAEAALLHTLRNFLNIFQIGELSNQISNDFKEIYRMRWQIETAYETLKDRLQIENFTGTKAALIEQDIYSTIYVSNLAEDIICDIEEQNAQHLKEDYKHTMQINRTVSIGILKNDLIYILTQENGNKKAEMLQQIYDEISRNIVPIRPERHYHRTKGVLAGKYSNTHKPVFFDPT